MLIYKGKLERFAAKRSQIQGQGGDEQGITLQTLIVTAVLVLMAVAAGVIIVAITNSSSDDLEEQSQDLDAKCAPWELHDLELEANGAGGGSQFTSGRFNPSSDESKAGRGGITSTKVGCLPVCYLKVNNRGDETLDDFLESGNGSPATDGSDLWFDNSNEPPGVETIRIGVTYARFKFGGGAHATEFRVNSPIWEYTQTNSPARVAQFQVGTHPIPKDAGSKLMVRVSDNKESCVIEDTSTSEIVYPKP